MRIRLLTAALVLYSTSLAAEPLYNQYNAGAPENEVLPAFPTAKFEGDENGVRKFRAEGVPLTGMWTYFYFSSGGLSGVTMYGRGADRYLEVKAALRKKYGAPQSDQLAADSGIAVWQVGGTRIVATLSASYSTIVGPVVQPFTVTYTAQSSETGDRF